MFTIAVDERIAYNLTLTPAQRINNGMRAARMENAARRTAVALAKRNTATRTRTRLRLEAAAQAALLITIADMTLAA